VQFCFFNAEEAGLHGSQAYAYNMKSLHAPIKAVICMDMIGYNKEPLNRIFEIHAGYPDGAIRDMCLPLATLIEKWAYTLPHKLGPAQIYKGLIQKPIGVVDDPWNRDKYDGAIERSDHFSFQKHNYPAVVVSEDLFINKPSPIEPENDWNINYHEVGDRSTGIDVAYGSDIIYAVAFAVKELAET
jgi:Zn-dependent M28 family amino/carboxypeptidase